MLPLGKRGGAQMMHMEVELVLMASIIIGAEGAGGEGKERITRNSYQISQFVALLHVCDE